MSSNPVSFRLPSAYVVPEYIEHKGERVPLPTQIRDNIRMLFNGLLDAHQALLTVNSNVTALSSKVSALPNASTVATAAAASAAAGVQTPGQVNDQSGVASYITQQTDYGSLVVVNNGGTGVPVTLNSSVSRNYYTRIVNLGSAAATLSPDGGFAGQTINGASNYSLAPNAAVTIFWNTVNKNFYAY